jgi:hypothetical protein
MPDVAFVDTLAPAYDRDVHAAHRAARARGWYARTPAGILVLGYDEVLRVLRDRRWRELGRDALRMAGITSGPLWDWFGRIISNQEGAAHTRLRKLVSQAFTARSADRLRPLMRESAHELVERMVRLGRCEFVSAFAAPYPLRVIAALLGVAPRDFERFSAWSTDLSLAFGSRIAEARPRIEAALASLHDWADEAIAERRRSPGPDLISALIGAEEAGERLSTDELRAMISVLIFGGQDTTQCQLACALASFAAHPEQWRRLAAHPELAASAAEEVLRFEPSGSGSPRVATEDLVLRDRELKAGTIALPSGPAANRDPAVFPDPDRFDILRRPALPNLTFGGGEHYCLGASLARAELQEALPILAQHLPALELEGGIEWRRQALIRGPERLPIRF